MNSLYLDTAMNACGVGVRHEAADRTTSILEKTSRGQAEKLVPFIDQAMQEAKLAPSDLDMITVTIGPGSFTGVRIALAAAQAMSSALNIPMLGLTTLEIIAKQAQVKLAGANEKVIAVILETKRSDYYCQCFQGTTLVPLTDPLALEADDLVKALEAFQEDQLVLIGDALTRLKEENAFQAYSTKAVMHHIDAPDPETALSLATAQSEKATYGKLSPLYLRSADVSQPKQSYQLSE